MIPGNFEKGGLFEVKREDASIGEFSAEDWIGRLSEALPRLDEVQQPFLREYWERNPSVHIVSGGPDAKLAEYPLDDLRDLYAMARHGHVFGEREYYAPLCAALDPARHIVMSHPTLAGAIGPIIGRDDFYMHVLSSGQSTSPSDSVAGLMARAAELSGDCLQAATELNAFLIPSSGEAGSEGVPNELDIGYHAVLFHGLTLTERGRRRGWHYIASIRETPFVRGQQAGGRTVAAGIGVPQLAVDRGRGETLSVEAHVQPLGPRRGI